MNYKFNLLTGKDKLRPMFQNVFLTREDVVATDAHVLGRIPTSEVMNQDEADKIPEEGILIAGEDWKRLLGANWIGFDAPGIIRATFAKKTDALIPYKLQKEVGTFPNWKQVTPPRANIDAINHIGLNASLFHRLQEALSPNCGFLIEFHGTMKAAIALPIYTDKYIEERYETETDYLKQPYGLIMPTKTDRR